MSVILPQDEDSIGCERIGDTNSETLLKQGEEQETHKETFREMIALLRDWAFMLFAVSNFLTSLGYPIPYTFVPVSPTCRLFLFLPNPNFVFSG